MRDSLTCPRCNHDEILFAPQLADRDDDQRVRPLVVHVGQYDWWGDKEFGQIQACVCLKCGYTELYTKDPATLRDKVPGAQVLKRAK